MFLGKSYLAKFRFYNDPRMYNSSLNRAANIHFISLPQRSFPVHVQHDLITTISISHPPLNTSSQKTFKAAQPQWGPPLSSAHRHHPSPSQTSQAATRLSKTLHSLALLLKLATSRLENWVLPSLLCHSAGVVLWPLVQRRLFLGSMVVANVRGWVAGPCGGGIRRVPRYRGGRMLFLRRYLAQ